MTWNLLDRQPLNQAKNSDIGWMRAGAKPQALVLAKCQKSSTQQRLDQQFIAFEPGVQ
jgi:hypothetical protein